MSYSKYNEPEYPDDASSPMSHSRKSSKSDKTSTYSTDSVTLNISQTPGCPTPLPTQWVQPKKSNRLSTGDPAQQPAKIYHGITGSCTHNVARVEVSLTGNDPPASDDNSPFPAQSSDDDRDNQLTETDPLDINPPHKTTSVDRILPSKVSSRQSQSVPQSSKQSEQNSLPPVEKMARGSIQSVGSSLNRKQLQNLSLQTSSKTGVDSVLPGSQSHISGSANIPIPKDAYDMESPLSAEASQENSRPQSESGAVSMLSQPNESPHPPPAYGSSAVSRGSGCKTTISMSSPIPLQPNLDYQSAKQSGGSGCKTSIKIAGVSPLPNSEYVSGRGSGCKTNIRISSGMQSQSGTEMYEEDYGTTPSQTNEPPSRPPPQYTTPTDRSQSNTITQFEEVEETSCNNLTSSRQTHTSVVTPLASARSASDARLSIHSVSRQSLVTPAETCHEIMTTPETPDEFIPLPPPYNSNVPHFKCTVARPCSRLSCPMHPEEDLVLRASLIKANTAPDVLEIDLVRELIFTLMSVEGQLIGYCPHEDRFVIRPGRGVPLSLRRLTDRVAECGWLHRKVRQYTDAVKLDPNYGVIGQAFSAAIHQHLVEYYRLIATIESQVKEDEHVLIRPGPPCHADLCNLTLKRLSLWTAAPVALLRHLVTLIEACGGHRGGSMASQVFAFLESGDLGTQSITRHILAEMVQPFYHMLSRWIFEGELDDQYQEFFVAADPAIKDEDRYWAEKYCLRQNMIPTFLTTKQASKVLLTGKSLNFIRHVCEQNVGILKNRDVIHNALIKNVDSVFQQDLDHSFDRMISTVYTETSHYLLRVLFDRFYLFDHLHAVRKFLLLGQGDFIQLLMTNLEPDLDKDASFLYLHDVVAHLESAIRGSNALFEPSYIRERLDVRLFELSTGDCGWDVFSLDYHMNGPLSTIFPLSTMVLYLRAFNFLWRVRRMEFLLSNLYRSQRYTSRVLARHKEMTEVLHNSQLILAEMGHFIKQLQYYINFEVLEVAWSKLLTRVGDAEDLDQVIQAHNHFISAILVRMLLDDKSVDLLNLLREIFDLILQFKDLQDQINTSMEEEAETQQGYQKDIENANVKGTWGTNTAKENKELKRRGEFAFKASGPFISNHKKLIKTYREKVVQFIHRVSTHTCTNLRFLGIRINYNYFYSSEDNPTPQFVGPDCSHDIDNHTPVMSVVSGEFEEVFTSDKESTHHTNRMNNDNATRPYAYHQPESVTNSEILRRISQSRVNANVGMSRRLTHEEDININAVPQCNPDGVTPNLKALAPKLSPNTIVGQYLENSVVRQRPPIGRKAVRPDLNSNKAHTKTVLDQSDYLPDQRPSSRRSQTPLTSISTEPHSTSQNTASSFYLSDSPSTDLPVMSTTPVLQNLFLGQLQNSVSGNLSKRVVDKSNSTLYNSSSTNLSSRLQQSRSSNE